MKGENFPRIKGKAKEVPLHEEGKLSIAYDEKVKRLEMGFLGIKMQD